MARDYAKFVPPKSRTSRRHKRRIGILLPFLLFLSAILISAIFWLNNKNPPSWNRFTTRITTFFHPNKVIPALKPTKKAAIAKHDVLPPPVHFDFYNELPTVQMTAHSVMEHRKVTSPIQVTPTAPNSAEKKQETSLKPDDISRLLAVENNTNNPHIQK